MSEAQAIETKEDIDIVEDVIDDQETESQETDESQEAVEIVLEGEEEPSSKNSTPYGLQKRFKKLHGKIEAGNEEAEKLKREIDLRDEQIKLLEMSSSKPDVRPDEDDFDSRAEYLAADQAWIDNRIDQKAAEKAAETLRANQTQTNAVNQDNQLMGKINNHYDRADKLKMPNYEALEDNAIDNLGNDFAKQLMANASKSHLILGHLGANPGKAQALAELAKTDPLKAYTEALEIGEKLSVKGKTPAPDPETQVEGGLATASGLQKKIDAAREKAARTGDMTELMAIKRQARESGA